MKKHLIDLQVKANSRLNERYTLLQLTSDAPLPDMQPGQFAELRIDHSPSTYLRRPISIHFVDRRANELWLLVACIGEGTRRLGSLRPGERLNCLLPLGHGFSPVTDGQKLLLVGGGVGVAPLLYQGAEAHKHGAEVTFLLGARSQADLLMLQEFEKYGRVLVTTEDGTMGERGFVTQHSVLQSETFDLVQVCGPTPMMKAVARYAREKHVECEVSLENLMACGLGACLCCVEKTVDGNLCVCKEGPVFNVNRLLWQD